MKKIFLTTVPLLIATGVGYYLNQRGADVRYQLSRPIAVESSGVDALKNLQQLEITNLGTTAALKVSVHVKKKLESFTLVKNSMAENYSSYPAGIGTEIIYDILPPQGTFTCTLTMGGETLNGQDVDVKHSEGTGRPALTNSTSAWSVASSALTLCMLAFYLWSGTNDVRLNGLRSQSHYAPLRVLQRHKPFLIESNDWQLIRSDALKNAYEEPRSFNVLSEWSGLKLLNSEKPDYLTDEEWPILLKAVAKTLMAFMTSQALDARLYSTTDRIGKLLEIPAPLNVSKHSWSELTKGLIAQYLGSLVDSLRWSGLQSLAKALKQNKPDYIGEDDWAKYRIHVQIVYQAKIFDDLRRSFEPLSTLADVDLTELEAERQKDIRDMAYKMQLSRLPKLSSDLHAEEFLRGDKPNWISQKDYDTLTSHAKQC